MKVQPKNCQALSPRNYVTWNELTLPQPKALSQHKALTDPAGGMLVFPEYSIVLANILSTLPDRFGN